MTTMTTEEEFSHGADSQGSAGPAAPADVELPIEGYVELDLSVDRLWQVFADVRGWPRWNKCFWWARVTGGELEVGATLYWFFNPIRPWYLYKMPAVARIVECEPARKVTWEVTKLPGFRARHSYLFEAKGDDRCRFGSWEVAEGPLYRALRRFWLAHFHYVCQSSLAGARALSEKEGR
jgi:hypothetical protein